MQRVKLLEPQITIRAEEANLCEAFGPDWTSYAAGVRRWI